MALTTVVEVEVQTMTVSVNVSDIDNGTQLNVVVRCPADGVQTAVPY